MKTRTMTTMGYGEFEKLVVEHLLPGVDYNYACEEELSNDTSKVYHATKKTDKWHDSDIAEAKKGKTSYKASALLNELCKLGHVPEGEVLIEICW